MHEKDVARHVCPPAVREPMFGWLVGSTSLQQGIEISIKHRSDYPEGVDVASKIVLGEAAPVTQQRHGCRPERGIVNSLPVEAKVTLSHGSALWSLTFQSC